MLRQALVVGLALCLLLSATACSQRNDMSSGPGEVIQSSAESIADNGESETASDNSDEETAEGVISQEELDEIFGKIPRKYQNYDKYSVARPKNDTIATYVFEDGKYEIIETPVPDYMLTLNDYLSPIRDKYDFPDIDRIVFDEKENMVCVNFTEKIESAIEKDVLDSISKTIIENDTLSINGVYFEVDMQNYPASVQ